MNAYGLNVAPFNGYETQFSAGVGAIVVAGAGAAASTAKASAGAAITVGAQGPARIALSARSDALITFSASGSPSAVYFGRCDAAIDVTALGTALLATQGQGNALIAFGGRYRVPGSLPVPSAYAPAPLTRWSYAEADLRLIRVASDTTSGERTIRASGDTRLVCVPAEPILPVRENRKARLQHEGRQA